MEFIKNFQITIISVSLILIAVLIGVFDIPFGFVFMAFCLVSFFIIELKERNLNKTNDI